MRFGRIRNLATGAIIAAAMTSVTLADQPVITVNGGRIHISGATLFADFFAAQAASNDYGDFDKDGIFGFNPNGPPFVDQLANDYNPVAFSTWWLVYLRGVGSGNGLAEFVNWQLAGTIPTAVPSEVGRINRYKWADTGVLLDGNVPPVQSVDLAVMDVPTTWFVQSGSSSNALWSRKPTQSGYGQNGSLSVGRNLACCLQSGQSNKLKTLTNGALSLNTNVGSPDANTIYDNPIAWVPIAFIVNRGTGIDMDCDGVDDQSIRYSDLRYLFLTGRAKNGMNLNVATRDSGSGTRNGAMNSIGVDPSWGVGDNVGKKLDVDSQNILGTCHQVSNCGGSGVIESAVRFDRLAIGYTGLAGASRAAADALAGQYEILGVIKDVDCDGNGLPDANTAVRPTLNACLDNLSPNSGYQVGGPETFASRGDPYGTDIDVNNDGIIDFPHTNTHPAMSSKPAAAFLRNLIDSIAGFVGNPPADVNQNMPGQFLATTFFLTASVDAEHNPTDPCKMQPTTGFNQSLQDYVRGASTLVTPAWGSVNVAGQVPLRRANPDFNCDSVADSYSDGSFDGSYTYRTSSGSATVTAGQRLGDRNRIQGDFNRDGRRDMNDIAKMMEAFDDAYNFEGGTNWAGNAGDQSQNNVIVAIIGDFNGDGNFDEADVRFFADGLAIDPSTCKLNRAEAFRQIDLAWQARGHGDNFFGTVWGDSRPYQPGDSALDVAGNAVITKGAAPTGSDGVIDVIDSNYVQAQITAGDLNSDGAADWADLNEAVRFDLTADVTGDCKVNSADLARYAACEPCDTNCDGSVNQFDIQTFIVDLQNGGGGCSGCAADANGDGSVNQFDINGFVTCLSNP